MSTHIGVYGTLLLAGLLGSIGHCLGMCGPLVIMVGLRMREQELATWPSHALYHFARVVVYGLLGAGVGAIGSLLGLGGRLSNAAGIVSLALGVGLLLLGMGYLGILSIRGLDSSVGKVSRAMGQVFRRGGYAGVILLGALNGLLPCGLVYSALLLAASTGGPLPGAMGMILFGLGTLPALFLVGMGAGALSVRLRQGLTRAAGVLILVVGLQLALRGLATLGFVPHLQFGELVVW
jgi:sulfite exporter TauE/SafE